MSTNLHTDHIGNLILRDGKLCLSVSSQYATPPHYGGGRVGALSPYAVEQVNHYYAYGGIIGNLSSNEGIQEFKFGDKKLDRTYGLDLYDFEARQYDAITPWFTSIDPHAEKYYGISPYAYCAGDPVNCVDPDGRDYGVRIVNGAVIVRADYYCPDYQSYESASQAASSWNNRSWQYEADGKPVVFNITAHLVDGIHEANYAIDEANPDKSVNNTYFVVKDSQLKEKENGQTQAGKVINIKESRSSSDSGEHEIGHSLGLQHESDKNNLMKDNSTERKGNDINVDQIKTILNKAGKTPSIDKNGTPAGKGTCNGPKFNFKHVRKIDVKEDE